MYCPEIRRLSSKLNTMRPERQDKLLQELAVQRSAAARALDELTRVVEYAAYDTDTGRLLQRAVAREICAELKLDELTVQTTLDQIEAEVKSEQPRADTSRIAAQEALTRWQKAAVRAAELEALAMTTEELEQVRDRIETLMLDIEKLRVLCESDRDTAKSVFRGLCAEYALLVHQFGWRVPEARVRLLDITEKAKVGANRWLTATPFAAVTETELGEMEASYAVADELLRTVDPTVTAEGDLTAQLDAYMLTRPSLLELVTWLTSHQPGTLRTSVLKRVCEQLGERIDDFGWIRAQRDALLENVYARLIDRNRQTAIVILGHGNHRAVVDELKGLGLTRTTQIILNETVDSQTLLRRVQLARPIVLLVFGGEAPLDGVTQLAKHTVYVQSNSGVRAVLQKLSELSL